ncbi:MAG: hypothetical protein AB1696_22630 [Planctomycetota bacterium]
MDRIIDWLGEEDHFWPILTFIVLLLIALNMASAPGAGPEAESLSAAKTASSSGLGQVITFFRDHR